MTALGHQHDSQGDQRHPYTEELAPAGRDDPNGCRTNEEEADGQRHEQQYEVTGTSILLQTAT